MKKDKSRVKFVCPSCGYESPRWLGRCPGCGEFNTLVEEKQMARSSSPSGRFFISPGGESKPESIASVSLSPEPRMKTPIEELNRVLGGGVVPGSVVLVGGDPGIGKSTLLLQMSNEAAKRFGKVLYVSGEESPKQIRMRGERLGACSEHLLIFCETNVSAVEEQAGHVKPSMVVIDSIQTLFSEEVPSVPGSIAQVRECTAALMRLAKSRNVPVFIIGHVTKEGVIAGPRVLEHMVDTVLYLEGERHAAFRILRSVKNRFGATDELGVFEMYDTGLREVSNPSEVFLSERPKNVPGSVVVPALEGTRPLLLELQALVSPAGLGIPRRQVLGLDYNRVALILAVLEKRAGFHLSSQDVYVNLTGGVRVEEPAADLGVAVAVASGIRDVPVDEELVVLGEIGLTGEIRAVSQVKKRVKEAAKLGFRRCLLPLSCAQEFESEKNGLEILPVKSVREAVEIALKR